MIAQTVSLSIELLNINVLSSVLHKQDVKGVTMFSQNYMYLVDSAYLFSYLR